MAQPKKRKATKKVKSLETKAPIIPEKYQSFAYIGLLILSVFIFFSEAIFGDGFNVADNIASISFRPYIDAAGKEGTFPQWMPYIFGGMPGYAALLTSGARYWDIVPQIVIGFTELIGDIFNNDLARVVSSYGIFAVGMFFLMRIKEHNRFISFFTAFAATFSTGIIIWAMIGHNTKPLVFAMFPFIFIFMERKCTS